MGALIVGFLGISLYGGMQAYVESDLQKAAMNAAMTGAAAMFSDVGPNDRPTRNPGRAQSVATNAFNTIINNSSLKGFGATLGTVQTNSTRDSVTVEAKASVGLPFLALVGISQFETTANATAAALRYEPTAYSGPVSILPVNGDINSYSKKLTLDFPLVDGPGAELYVEQDPVMQQPYIVEACSAANCYSLVGGATPVGTSKVVTLPDGSLAIIGTAMIDLARVGIRKAAVLRFVHGNAFDSWNAGVLNPPPTVPTPTVIRRVMLFGYAGSCSSPTSCTPPVGFFPAGK